MQAACKSCEAFLCAASVESDIAAGMNFHSVKVIRTSKPECEAELGMNGGGKILTVREQISSTKELQPGQKWTVTEYLHLLQSPKTELCEYRPGGLDHNSKAFTDPIKSKCEFCGF